MARVVNALCPQDIDEYIRRLTTIVVIGNLDAHLKNWTLRYPDGLTTRLSPAYDFVSVSAYQEFRAEELAFPVNGGRIAKLISLDNFRHLADRAHLDVTQVIDTVTQMIAALLDSWPAIKRDLPVPSFVRDHIDQRLTSLPLIPVDDQWPS
ncbi:hypothetical protein Acor_49490 [Acrocarpospora corrugata]|uniref:HipA-like C-terminal domain-containing protein n=1 Tax=Acrocarpospora corrugata TaxID=35763 RepID=A0A5M3W6S0_9ACTN|nr:hypothetical protein Acor_49490 [Acrocarpospora corrugata]